MNQPNETYTQTTIRVPDTLLRRFKKHLIDINSSMQEFTLQAIEKELQKQSI